MSFQLEDLRGREAAASQRAAHGDEIVVHRGLAFPGRGQEELTTPKLAVRGRVVGPEGEPVADARVTGRDGMILTTTSTDGSFAVWAGRSERSGLRVESDGYAPADFQPNPGTALEVRLERGAVISGLLLGLPEKEAKLASVYLEGEGGDLGLSPAEIWKGPDGRWNYELRGVRQGSG